jgi:signal transduction histidine kinase
MRNTSLIKRNEEMLKKPNQMYLKVNNDTQEKNMQSLIQNQQLLKDKEKAEERDQQKSAFLANMVHEIRTPIYAIKSFAEFLQAPDLTEENKVKFSQIISQCTDNLLNLVNDLLDISRIEAGQLTIIKSSGNIENLFNELFELFNTAIVQKEQGIIQLKSCIQLTHRQCQVDSDFLRLRQILINLISNALKFTEKGHVLFGCRLIDYKTLCFYVEDSGIGIAQEKQTVIFERFMQIMDPNSLNRCKGTGLGLSIVKSLVELMNGQVWVESTMGIGTTFYFTLPYIKTASTKAIIKNSVSCN